MSTPSSPLSMDAKTKFQQLWAQFGNAFMEEPMLRDHSKRVEDLVRENERLRLEISSAKAEQSKQTSEHKLTAEELESLREEVNQEVKSGMERVQERNVALARKEKEVVSLRRELKGREAVWAQERQKYKQTIRLLRDELESAVVAHDRLRKNVGVLTGEYEGSGDEYDEEEEQELANQAELQLQAERSLQAGASYRRASRRLQVEETPGVEEADENVEPADDEEEYEYYEAEDGQVGSEGEDEEADHQAEEEAAADHDEDDVEPDEDDVEQEEDEEEAGASGEEKQEAGALAEPEQTLRRSTRIRQSEATAETEPFDGHETIELIGTKRGRDQSSDRATVDGAAQIPDRQTEYKGVPATQPASADAEDIVERPPKRTRRQTERYSNALESNKNFAKIMTPPATSPPFLPSVLPRRRSPARKSTTLSQTSTPVNRRGPKRGAAAAAAAAVAATAQLSPASAPPKAKATQTAKSPTKTPAKGLTSPTRSLMSPAKSLKSPRVTKKAPKESPWSAYPKKKVEFTLVSGSKHGRNIIVDDPEVRDQMDVLLPRSTERIRQVAFTSGFWRSYAHKRNIQRKEQGLSEHCAFTSQYPLDSKEVETENQWVDGVDFACSNCIKEGIACFTVGPRLDTEKYGAIYRPPKRS